MIVTASPFDWIRPRFCSKKVSENDDFLEDTIVSSPLLYIHATTHTHTADFPDLTYAIVVGVEARRRLVKHAAKLVRGSTRALFGFGEMTGVF